MNCPNCGYNPQAQSYAYQQNNYQQRTMSQAQGMLNQEAQVVRMETDIPTTPRESNDPPPEPKPTAWDQFKGLIREVFP